MRHTILAFGITVAGVVGCTDHPNVGQATGPGKVTTGGQSVLPAGATSAA